MLPVIGERCGLVASKVAAWSVRSLIASLTCSFAWFSGRLDRLLSLWGSGSVEVTGPLPASAHSQSCFGLFWTDESAPDPSRRADSILSGCRDSESLFNWLVCRFIMELDLLPLVVPVMLDKRQGAVKLGFTLP